MKIINRINLFLCLFVLISCSQNNGIRYNPPKQTKQWVEVWSEEFDNGIDWTVWSKVPRGTSDWNNYMSDIDTLFDVKNGNLILYGIVNNGLVSTDTAKYLTGGLWSKDKKLFGEGRIEIRARFDQAEGFWPAVWMLPHGQKWPHGGEIDILEHLNFDNFIYQTVHSNYTYNLAIKSPKPSAQAAVNPCDYAIYGVDRYNDSIVFFVNRKRIFSYPRIKTDKDGQFPFSDYPFYLIMSAQLGGSWVGAVQSGQLPVSMYIDWVRFYQKQ